MAVVLVSGGSGTQRPVLFGIHFKFANKQAKYCVATLTNSATELAQSVLDATSVFAHMTVALGVLAMLAVAHERVLSTFVMPRMPVAWLRGGYERFLLLALCLFVFFFEKFDQFGRIDFQFDSQAPQTKP